MAVCETDGNMPAVAKFQNGAEAPFSWRGAMSSVRRRVFLAHNSCFNASYDLNILRIGLERGGYEIVSRPEHADEVIYSGCSVRDKCVTDAINQIGQIHTRAPSANITVTGCIANVSKDAVRNGLGVKDIAFQQQQAILKDRTGLDFGSVDANASLDTTHDYEGAWNGLTQLRQRVGPEKATVVAELQKIDREYGLDLAHTYQRETKGFVFYHEVEPASVITVARSCLYQCSFCSIPQGRGPFTSVPLQDIVAKARTSLLSGINRLILVGDEVGNYGADGQDEKFPELLNALVALDPGIRLSIRYIEPKPFIKHADLLRRLSDSGNIDLLYVSMQSGSLNILKRMNRGTGIEKAVATYSDFRRNTDVVFYCNWMVGFPGETEDDFAETVALAKRLNLQINVAIPFSSRPDTAADQYGSHLSENIKCERVQRLTEVLADVKAAQFHNRLSFLEEERREPLLELIRAAEKKLYAEPTSEVRPVVLYKRAKEVSGNV